MDEQVLVSPVVDMMVRQVAAEMWLTLTGKGERTG